MVESSLAKRESARRAELVLDSPLVSFVSPSVSSSASDFGGSLWQVFDWRGACLSIYHKLWYNIGMKREDGPADITSGKHEDPVKAIKAELISTLSEQCRDCLLIGYLAEDLAELAVRQTVADMDNVHGKRVSEFTISSSLVTGDGRAGLITVLFTTD